MKNTEYRNTEKMNQFKTEVAVELGVDLAKGGENTSRENGHVGGEMTKRMVEAYEKNMK